MPRIAIVSDIHGNLSAFEAVLADLQRESPDLVLHGGDLADGGSAPVEIVDRIRDLGWPGVLGNTDEMLFQPEPFREFASRAPGLSELFKLVEEMAIAAREALGEERIAWLRDLPATQQVDSVTLLHASPGNLWQAPAANSTDDSLLEAYETITSPVVVYGHIHCPFVRSFAGKTVANTGSVGLPYDGDPRASYVIIDGQSIQIKRVEYDIDREIKAIHARGIRYAAWIGKMLTSARPQMP